MAPAPSAVTTDPPVAAGSQGLLGVDAAREAMLRAVALPRGIERVTLSDALGRVLAEDLLAGVTMPRWPNSAMDGYAFRIAEAEAAREPGLPIRQVVAAGSWPEPLQPGTAARIFTGAPLPAGADTVVMQEHCRTHAGRVVIERLPEGGCNVRQAGEDFHRGNVLLESGCVLRPQHIALAASAGAGTVPVFRQPRVAIVVTGSELVSPGRALDAGQIHESNGALLGGLIGQLGAIALTVRIVRDDRDATSRVLGEAAAEADLVVTSGGVSVGDTDHVRNAVEAIGELALFGVAIKPGKPVAFGRVGNTPLLGLPGNPVSAFATFALLGAPLIRHLQGRRITMPDPLQLPARFERTSRQKRAEYLRVRLDHGGLTPQGNQGSGILSALADADGLACVPPDAGVAPGDALSYYSMDSLLA